MGNPDLNTRVIDKLGHITQLTDEIRQLVVDEFPEDLQAVDSALTAIEDRTHRLAKQLSHAPLGTLQF